MSGDVQLLIGNDLFLILSGLEDGATGDFITSATVTATLFDPDGSTVDGQTWPMSLDYVDPSELPTDPDLLKLYSSDGNYRGIISSTCQLVERETYTIQILADDGTGRQAKWEFTRQALNRDSS